MIRSENPGLGDATGGKYNIPCTRVMRLREENTRGGCHATPLFPTSFRCYASRNTYVINIFGAEHPPRVPQSEILIFQRGNVCIKSNVIDTLLCLLYRRAFEYLHWQSFSFINCCPFLSKACAFNIVEFNRYSEKYLRNKFNDEIYIFIILIFYFWVS